MRPRLDLAGNLEAKNPGDVLSHSMGPDRKSYSPLKLINKSNVKRLVPVWSTSLTNDWGDLSAPAPYQNSTLWPPLPPYTQQAAPNNRSGSRIGCRVYDTLSGVRQHRNGPDNPFKSVA